MTCPVCNRDDNAYLTCNRPDCIDGRHSTPSALNWKAAWYALDYDTQACIRRAKAENARLTDANAALAADNLRLTALVGEALVELRAWDDCAPGVASNRAIIAKIAAATEVK